MITGTEIYWVTRLDYFQTTALVAGAIGVVLAAIWTIVSIGIWCDNDKEGREMFKFAAKTLLVMFVLLVSGFFIPSTKEMCAVKALPAIINNEDVQAMPDKLVGLANEWLDELKPQKKIGEQK